MSRYRKSLPTVQRLRELLTYNPTTGVFHWKPRPGKSSAWSKRIANPAGWHDTLGYLRLKLDRKTYQASRVAWAMTHGAIDTDIDHINGDPGDCRLGNLRAATYRQNAMNRCAKKTKLRGLPKGVFGAKSGKFVALLRTSKALLYLGTHEEICEAQYAYAMGARSKFGRFARVA